MVNICDQCDKTKCIGTKDPIEGHANAMHCSKKWNRSAVSDYLRKNGWSNHRIAQYWGYDSASEENE